jgi:hypothetical protein
MRLRPVQKTLLFCISKEFCQDHPDCVPSQGEIMTEAPLKGWNRVPDVPIQVSPLFSWPLRPFEILAWVWNSWFLITEKLIIVAVAFNSFYWF